MIHVYKKSLRGDTVRWKFQILYMGKPYEIQPSDVVAACAKKKTSDPDGAAIVASSSIVFDVLDQITDTGVVDMTISSDVTNVIQPGHYYIDIQLTRHDVSPIEVVTPIRIMWEFSPDVLRAR